MKTLTLILLTVLLVGCCPKSHIPKHPLIVISRESWSDTEGAMFYKIVDQEGHPYTFHSNEMYNVGDTIK